MIDITKPEWAEAIYRYIADVRNTEEFHNFIKDKDISMLQYVLWYKRDDFLEWCKTYYPYLKD